MTEPDIVRTPGWTAVVDALRAAEVHLNVDPARLAQLTINILGAVRPAVQAEVLANLADEFGDEFPELALSLDEASHQIRETLTR